MNMTSTPATITHIALMLASGVSRIGVASAAPATPGSTSEAIAATGPAIMSLFFIDFPPSPPEHAPAVAVWRMTPRYEPPFSLCLDGWSKSQPRGSPDWRADPCDGQ